MGLSVPLFSGCPLSPFPPLLTPLPLPKIADSGTVDWQPRSPENNYNINV